MSLHHRPRRPWCARRAAWRLAVTFLAAVTVSACRADVEVAITAGRDGRGTVVVTVTADAELVGRAPGLAADLRTDDLVTAGWSVDGPSPTPDGGLTATVSHPFAGTDEANALLAELGGEAGPFPGLHLEQSISRTRIVTSLSGRVLVSSPDAFSDAALDAALGDRPYGALLAESGASLADSLGVSVTATFPGEVSQADGTVTAAGSGGSSTVHWTADLAGAAASEPGQTITLRSVVDDGGARRAARLRDAAPFALAAWGALFSLVIVPIAVLRRRRRRRAPVARG